MSWKWVVSAIALPLALGSCGGEDGQADGSPLEEELPPDGMGGTGGLGGMGGKGGTGGKGGAGGAGGTGGAMPIDCGPHGMDDGTGACVCDPGYTGTFCDICADGYVPAGTSPLAARTPGAAAQRDGSPRIGSDWKAKNSEGGGHGDGGGQDGGGQGDGGGQDGGGQDGGGQDGGGQDSGGDGQGGGQGQGGTGQGGAGGTGGTGGAGGLQCVPAPGTIL